MGQCQCPTTQEPQQNVPNYVVLTRQVYQQSVALDSLPNTIKPYVNQLDEFLKDNWIRVPHVVSIIEERLQHTTSECDVHASLVALISIMRLINNRVAKDNKRKSQQVREELIYMEQSIVIDTRNNTDFKTRTRSESQKTAILSNEREVLQQVTQQVNLVQQQMIRCLLIVQDIHILIMPFNLYQELLGQVCVNLSSQEPKIMAIVLLVQEILTRYFIKQLHESFEVLPQPLKLEVNNRRKKKIIIGMLSKEIKAKDMVVSRIVDQQMDDSQCMQLVSMYLNMVNVVEKNRKFYELTTLFLNDDQRLLLQTFIFLKVREHPIATEYLFEFLDLYHKKAVQMKLFQELFECIFMNFDEKLWEDEPIIRTLFSILLKSAHYEDIKDNHELYILGALFQYLEQIQTQPNLKVICTVLLCVELFLKDLGFGEFLHYQMSSKFGLLIIMVLLTRDERAQQLICVWFELLQEPNIYFDYLNLILDYIVSIGDTQTQQTQKDIVCLLKLMLRIIVQPQQEQIYLPEEVILRLFDVAKYPSFEVQTMVLQVSRALIVEARMLMSEGCQSLFFCVFWMLEYSNIAKTTNELAIKYFFDITHHLLQSPVGVNDSIVLSFLRHIQGHYFSQNQALQRLCQLITFVVIDDYQFMRKKERVSSQMNISVAHPVSLSTLKKLLRSSLTITNLEAIVDTFPNKTLFHIAQQRIGIKQSYRRESRGSIVIQQLERPDSIPTNPVSSYQSTIPEHQDFDYLYSKMAQRVDICQLFNSGKETI